jgi:ABC-2 type transport system ATP-binding protein
MSTSAIWTQELTRDFGSLRAVDALSLAVEPGSLFGFLGPNGAGKTTVIRLLLGLLTPTAGRAEVLGFDTRTQAREIRTRTGALLEHAGLYERLTAEDNLELYGRIGGLTAAQRRVRIAELLGHLGLLERRHELVGTWSRGMKQKLAVARAMLHHPQLLFLDEPTAGLDAVSAAALRTDLKTLVGDDATTVFLTTHNLAEAEMLCDHVAVIQGGRLLAQGRPDELRASTSEPRITFVGHDFSEALVTRLRQRSEVATVDRQPDGLSVALSRDSEIAPLIALVVDSGAKLEEVRRGKPTLEEAFLDLVETTP